MVARRECAVLEALRVDASIDPYSVGADSISARGPCPVSYTHLGLADHKGLLEPGYDADVVLVDIDHMYEVHADELHSKSKNCPYDGALLYGKVVTTIKGGKVTFQIEE